MAKETQSCEFHSGAAFSCLWHAPKFFEDPLPWANQPQETSEWLMQLRQIGSCPGATRPEAFVVRATWVFIYFSFLCTLGLWFPQGGVSRAGTIISSFHFGRRAVVLPLLVFKAFSWTPGPEFFSSTALWGGVWEERVFHGRGSHQAAVPLSLKLAARCGTYSHKWGQLSVPGLHEVPPCKSGSPFLNEHGTRSQDPGSRPSSATY